MQTQTTTTNMQYMTNAPESLAGPFDPMDVLATHRTVVFTDEHPVAKHGRPVLVHEGLAYGPSELPRFEILWGTGMMHECAGWLRDGGWTVEPEPCRCPAYGHVVYADDVEGPCDCTSPRCRCRRSA